MSQENVEVVKAFTRRFEGGDRDEWREYFDPNVVFDTSATEMPFAGVYHGHQGIERFFRDWLGTWKDYEIAHREYTDAGDAVVVVFRQSGTGRAAGPGPSGTSLASTNCANRRSCGIGCTSPARKPSKPPGCGSSEACVGDVEGTSKEGEDHERQHRDRGPRRRLRLDRAATAAPPQRGHLHPRGMDRRRGRQPDRGEPWRSRRGGRGRLRPGADLLSGPTRVLLPGPSSRPRRTISSAPSTARRSSVRARSSARWQRG